MFIYAIIQSENKVAAVLYIYYSYSSFSGHRMIETGQLKLEGQVELARDWLTY